ncbi:MAG: hypothetical protein ACQER6_08160 [Pseudomonadota bacterium]
MNPFVLISRPLTALLLALGLAFSATPTVADTLRTGAADAERTTSVHGLTQAQVKARYGEPETRHAPVPATGTRLNPPIIRWDYDGFSVFFERDIAIHRVEHLKAAE